MVVETRNVLHLPAGIPVDIVVTSLDARHHQAHLRQWRVADIISATSSSSSAITFVRIFHLDHHRI
jgi:hypothetical protein